MSPLTLLRHHRTGPPLRDHRLKDRSRHKPLRLARRAILNMVAIGHLVLRPAKHEGQAGTLLRRH
jgi:hypothetical protein